MVSTPTTDPLSEVFSLLNIRAGRCTRFEASGRWAYRFPAKPALKFGAILKGDCWIDFGDAPRHRLAAGDCFLLANAPDYVLANDDDRPPEDGVVAFDWTKSDIARHQGDDLVSIAGSFSFEASDAELLLRSLPRFLLIPAGSTSSSVIRATLEILDLEIGGTKIGAPVLTDRLVDILLVQVLRAALEQDTGRDFGWISALADNRIGRTLTMIHGDPARNWNLDGLAEAVAMSRSAFAKRFRLLVGLAPLDYLIRWRMRLAREMLRHGATVATVASKVGYSSESAFGHAFKRIYGHPPRRYWRLADG